MRPESPAWPRRQRHNLPSALPAFAVPVAPFPIAEVPPRFNAGVAVPGPPAPVDVLPRPLRPAVVIEAQEAPDSHAAGSGHAAELLRRRQPAGRTCRRRACPNPSPSRAGDGPGGQDGTAGGAARCAAGTAQSGRSGRRVGALLGG